MAKKTQKPDGPSGDGPQFEDWDAALDDWDAQFEALVDVPALVVTTDAPDAAPLDGAPEPMPASLPPPPEVAPSPSISEGEILHLTAAAGPASSLPAVASNSDDDLDSDAIVAIEFDTALPAALSGALDLDPDPAGAMAMAVEWDALETPVAAASLIAGGTRTGSRPDSSELRFDWDDQQDVETRAISPLKSGSLRQDTPSVEPPVGWVMPDELLPLAGDEEGDDANFALGFGAGTEDMDIEFGVELTTPFTRRAVAEAMPLVAGESEAAGKNSAEKPVDSAVAGEVVAELPAIAPAAAALSTLPAPPAPTNDTFEELHLHIEPARDERAPSVTGAEAMSTGAELSAGHGAMPQAMELVGAPPPQASPPVERSVAAVPEIAAQLSPQAFSGSSPAIGAEPPLPATAENSPLPADGPAPVSRLPERPLLPLLSVPAFIPPPPPDAAGTQELSALFESERALARDPARQALFDCAMARLCEATSDRVTARLHYESALADDPKSLTALRGLRRVALADGDAREALGVIEREAALVPEMEAVALAALRAELLLSVADLDGARAAFSSLRERDAGLAGLWARAALADVSPAADGAVALGELAAATGDLRLRAALLTVEGRSLAAAGTDEARALAAARFEAALAADPACQPAALSLLRVALRRGDGGGEMFALERLAEGWSGAGTLAGAVRRRLASVRLNQCDAARFAEAAASLSDARDLPSLQTRLRLEEELGSDAALAETLLSLAAASSGEARVENLLKASETDARRGEAARALRTAEEAHAAAPGDPRALAAIGRATSKTTELHLALRALGDDATAIKRSARALAESGSFDAAIALLETVPAEAPGGGLGVDEMRNLYLADGRVEAAAALLARTAFTLRRSHRLAADLKGLEAAILYARAGLGAAALDEARALGDGPLSATARRFVIELVETSPRPADHAGALAEALAGEAAVTSPGRAQAALHHRRGRALASLVMAESHGSRDSIGDAALAAEQQALDLDPAHAPALVALELGSSDGEAAAAHLRRMELTQGLARTAEGLRAAHLLERAGDPRAAAACYARVLAQAGPGAAVAIEGRLTDLAQRAGDDAAAAGLVARQLAEMDEGTRFGTTLRRAERAERERRTDDALALFHDALEQSPESLIARDGIERLLLGAGRLADLDAQIRRDLATATDARSRVRAYERLAQIEDERFGDSGAALTIYQTILEQDHAHHPAFRALELRYLAEDRNAELIALYEQMGLTATDPQLATAVILERARLRDRLGSDADDLENDYRKAIFKDPRCRPALRRLLALAEQKQKHGAVAELCERLATLGTQGTVSPSVFSARAADAHAALGHVTSAIAGFLSALRQGGLQTSWLRSLIRVALPAGEFVAALEGAELAATACLDPVDRLRAGLVAGALAADQLADRERAAVSFRKVLDDDPGHPEAFDRVASMLEQRGEFAERAQILAARAAVERDPARAAELHLQLGRQHRDLGDSVRARAHLQEALATDPGHRAALALLADLHQDAGDVRQAADTLLERTRVENDPALLAEIWLRLGLIYADQLPDPERAIGSFMRVLERDLDHRVALERIAALYQQNGDPENALVAVSRLVELEQDPVLRVPLLLWAANIQDVGLRNRHAALETLRRAVALAPHDVAAISALTLFFERHGEAMSARVHLDMTVKSLRQAAARDPLDPTPYHSLFEAFRLRRSIDQAQVVAQLLSSLSAALPAEAGWLERHPVRETGRVRALVSPAVDDALYPSGIPQGFRHLIKPLDEALQKLFRGDVKRFGVGRAERVPKVHVLREAANQVAAELGVREPELYVTNSQPSLVALELTDPISIILGERVIGGATPSELRFVFVRILKLVQSGLAVPLRMSPDELGVLVGGIVRQLVPDYVPKGFEASVVAQEAARLARIVPRKMHQELIPFALECAAPDLDWRTIPALLVEAGNRAGLLAAGSVEAPLSLVRRLGDEAQMRTLLSFAVSDELAELRHMAGLAAG